MDDAMRIDLAVAERDDAVRQLRQAIEDYERRYLPLAYRAPEVLGFDTWRKVQIVAAQLDHMRDALAWWSTKSPEQGPLDWHNSARAMARAINLRPENI